MIIELLRKQHQQQQQQQLYFRIPKCVHGITYIIFVINLKSSTCNIILGATYVWLEQSMTL